MSAAQLTMPETRPRYRGGWLLSSSSDPEALAVVDGLDPFSGHGPHYSRRSPGSKTFTGMGQEIVLLHECLSAVWAVVYQKTPAAKGTGSSRGRSGATDSRTRFLWRNMLFRRIKPGCRWRASDLIKTATEATYTAWLEKYGALPAERLRTEIELDEKRTGQSYREAGYVDDRTVRGKLYLWAPARRAV